MLKIMFSAGEASGDLHGAGLAAALKKQHPDLEMAGFGGPKMKAAGVRLCHDFREYSVMGFWEVLKNLRRLFQLRDELVRFMQQEKPDLLVLIDYPDFNWRLAKKARALGIPVFSYIPPSAWAWRKGRARDCAKIADEFVAIFPFELPPYEAAGARISFLGNPLVDAVQPELQEAEAREFFGIMPRMRPVLLLPGSRKQEIELLLPVMLQAASRLKDDDPRVEFFLPVAAGIEADILERMAAEAGVCLHLVMEHTYDLMRLSVVAIATSGTVVMEAALCGLPCIVLYRMSLLTYWIGRMLVQVDNFSLPNILLGERIQPELLQDQVNPDRIVRETQQFLQQDDYRAQVAGKLADACHMLGEPGAAGRVADRIWQAAVENHEKRKTIGGKR